MCFLCVWLVRALVAPLCFPAHKRNVSPSELLQVGKGTQAFLLLSVVSLVPRSHLPLYLLVSNFCRTDISGNCRGNATRDGSCGPTSGVKCGMLGSVWGIPETSQLVHNSLCAWPFFLGYGRVILHCSSFELAAKYVLSRHIQGL